RAELAVSGGRNQRSGQGEEAGTELWQFQYNGLSYPRTASGHPVVRTGDGTRSPASATNGEGATSLFPPPVACRTERCRYRTGLVIEGRCLDKAVWVERDRKSHIAGPVGARGLEELGMEDDDEEASSRDRKSGAVGDDTEDDREENWAGSVVNSGRGDLSRVTDRLKPARAEANGNSSTAESVGIMVHIPSPPQLLSTEFIIPTLYGVCLSPRRSFLPLFINVFMEAASVLRRADQRLLFGQVRAGRALCLLFGRAYPDLPIVKEPVLLHLNTSCDRQAKPTPRVRIKHGSKRCQKLIKSTQALPTIGHDPELFGGHVFRRAAIG
ncbi:hypothetical protein THAOC_29054, partial [Thalassiosira oceanica]